MNSCTKPVLIVVVTALAIGCLGCATDGNKVASEMLTLKAESTQRRQIETRRFQTGDEKALLLSAAGLLQDMGYVIEEAETNLGLVVGEKDRDATDSGQIAGAIVLAVFTGVVVATDAVQKVRAALVTIPDMSRPGFVGLRVTFQRVIWDSNGRVSRRETITDEAIYAEFFSKLSKSVFLEAHAL